MRTRVWWEDSKEQHDYDLSDFRLLIVIAEDFDYVEMINIKKHWESWGATVDVAGTEPELFGHLWRLTEKGFDRSERKTIRTDLPVADVKIADYRAVLFPGGDSPKNLLETAGEKVTGLVKNALEKGLVVAAVSHGGAVLSATGIVAGRKVTGHKDITRNLTDAGAEYVHEVCVIDGNLITGNSPYFETMAVKVAEKLLYPKGGGPSEKSPFATNPVLKTIKDRRSVRRFLDKEVDSETVKTLLKAAAWAPSADNEQPWMFITVKDKAKKQNIMESFMNRMTEYYESHGIPMQNIRSFWSGIFDAPLIIFAFCDMRNIEIEQEGENIQIDWAVQAVTLACQNIMLAAKALNLGSLWMGLTVFIEDTIKQMLGVPDGMRLVTTLAIGYPILEPLPRPRRPIVDVSFDESWGERAE